MLYICIVSNKLDLIRATSVFSYKVENLANQLLGFLSSDIPLSYLRAVVAVWPGVSSSGVSVIKLFFSDRPGDY
jgi:hypothetical protein